MTFVGDAVDRPILVVDDDAKILRLVRMYLEREGFRVIELWLERHRRMWAKRLNRLERHMDEAP